LDVDERVTRQRVEAATSEQNRELVASGRRPVVRGHWRIDVGRTKSERRFWKNEKEEGGNAIGKSETAGKESGPLNVHDPKKNDGGRLRNRRRIRQKPIDLDDVDLSRQIRGNLEADFLLANRGLHPGLHGNSSFGSHDQRAASPTDAARYIGRELDNGKSQVRDLAIREAYQGSLSSPKEFLIVSPSGDIRGV
jgi:hypothetical protein